MITVYGLNKLGFTSVEDFILQDDGSGVYIKDWFSKKPQPSEADITTAHNNWQAEYDAQAYARKRQAEYPDWGIQLEKIDDDGLTRWREEMIDPVKSKWPKDNSGPK